ncbi:MAG TPA: hypothetical protein VJ301_12260 [Propionibacteriaceae bacterium]|nr:hypothetical protein [Propionibacteriaceae bacterium]
MPASTKTAVAIASGVLALGAGIGVMSASYASADITPTPSPTSAPSTLTPSAPTPSSPPPGTEQPGWPSSPDQAEQEAALIKVLSEMFGVDEAEVKAALDEMRAAYEAAGGPAAVDGYLDEAVRSGILTQEEADMIRQAVEQGMSNSGPR